MQKTSKQVFNKSLAYRSANVFNNVVSIDNGFSSKIKNIQNMKCLRQIKRNAPRSIKNQAFFNDFKLNSGFEPFTTIEIRTINFFVLKIMTRDRILLAQTMLYLESIMRLWFEFFIVFVRKYFLKIQV